MTQRKPRGFRLITLQSSEQLTRSMHRLRFTGRDLQHLATDDNLHVRLHLPTDSVSEFHTRYYTIRRVDAEAGWLDIDFVIHDDGPGTNFARHAVPGILCGLSGPCGLGIKQAKNYLLAGDETALPAIARIAETLPKEAIGSILLEVENETAMLAIETPPGMNVMWFYRYSTPASDAFLTALREQIVSLRSLSDRFAWIAGEHEAVMPLRIALKGIPSLCVPYWRRA